MGWDVGNPIGTGDDIGAPEVPYMSYGPWPEESEEEKRERIEKAERELEISDLKFRAERISKEAWDLNQEGRYDEALVFINRSLEICEKISNSWNRKAIILYNMKRYEEAISNYDRAIGLRASQIYKRNKAECLIHYCYHLKDIGNDRLGLERIERALEIFQGLDDRRWEDEAWNLKGIFLERTGDVSSALDCYNKAVELAADDGDLKNTYIENRDKLLRIRDDDSITCPRCGNGLKMTDRFCPECGKLLTESDRQFLKDHPNWYEENKPTREYSGTCDATILHLDDE